MPDFIPTLRQRLEFLGFSSLISLIECLPYRWLRHIANAVGSVVFLFDKRGKDVALANLESAFGNSRTPAEKRRIAVGSYRTFARTMLELFWSPNLSESVTQSIAHFEGIEDSCHKDRRSSRCLSLSALLELRMAEPAQRLFGRQWSGRHTAIQKSALWPHFRPFALQYGTQCDPPGARDDSDAQAAEKRRKI